MINYVETMFTCKLINIEKEIDLKWAKFHRKVSSIDKSMAEKVHLIVNKNGNHLRRKYAITSITSIT